MQKARGVSAASVAGMFDTPQTAHAAAAPRSPSFTSTPSASAGATSASEAPSTLKLVVPVAHQWNASAIDKPSVVPLAAPLKELGYNGKTAHVSRITLKSTTSNAPSALKGVLKSVLPPTASGDHVVAKLADSGTGKPASYVIPPGHTKHDEVLYENVLPTGTAVDLASHAKIDPASLSHGVVDNPALSNVLVFEQLSPKLHAMLEKNLSTGKFKTATAGASGDKNYIDISRAEYTEFLKNYQQQVHSHIPKTSIAEHSVALEPFNASSGAFGANVAQSAVHAHEREQFGMADAQHQVVSVLEYEITPHE